MSERRENSLGSVLESVFQCWGAVGLAAEQLGELGESRSLLLKAACFFPESTASDGIKGPAREEGRSAGARLH